jgi:hypothetical protein
MPPRNEDERPGRAAFLPVSQVHQVLAGQHEERFVSIMVAVQRRPEARRLGLSEQQ